MDPTGTGTRTCGGSAVEGVALERIAGEVGTPCFVYSRAAMERAWRDYDRALAGIPHEVCYAVKANSNLAVIDVLGRLGAGFDIVSGGELERVLAAGVPAGRIVFSGVGKRDAEMAAALEAGVGCFNVESAQELDRLASLARAAGKRAPVSLRVNPDIDARTHPYITTGLNENKFGVPAGDVLGLYARAAASPSLEVRGIDCHIGSQLASLEPFLDALDRLLALVDTLAGDGIRLAHLNLGGGLGIRYRDESPPEPAALAGAVADRLAGRDIVLMLEPGRSIVGNAGVLLTRVEYLKRNGAKRFAVVDAAMNDLIRPALYDAWHDIVPVRIARGRAGAVRDRRTGLRVRGLPRPRAAARAGARRPARGALGRRLRVRDELELQHAPSRRGGHGRRGPLPRGAETRAGTRSPCW